MKDICMKDCNFSINEEKRTVTCWIEGTQTMFYDFVFENCRNGLLTGYKNYNMNNRFVGKAVCAEQDEWDPEIGKEIAYYRMRRKLMDSFYNHIRMFFDAREKELDKFEQVCLDYRDKVEASLAKHAKVVHNVCAEN